MVYTGSAVVLQCASGRINFKESKWTAHVYKGLNPAWKEGETVGRAMPENM